MKKIFFAALALTALLFTSCENDDIEIVVKDSSNVSVSLSNFFSSYDFQDTKHDVDNASDIFRVFNSEYGMQIQTRVLFYNASGQLVDSLLNYSTNTNAVSKSIQLPEGKYTAVATLTFSKGPDASYWTLKEKENLNTAYIDAGNNNSVWSILAYDSQEVSVEKGRATDITLTPSPVGTLCYEYYQNFQFVNQASYPNAADNNVRTLGVLTQNYATGYKLNPKATDKYIYKDDAGSTTWWYLSRNDPDDYNSSWTWFQSNLYGFFYILAPKCSIIFGYMKKGDTGFTGYGEAHYNITTGKTFLAYWDWFKVGNPYFGIADNSHWNTYKTAPYNPAPNPRMFLDRTTLSILDNYEQK